MGNRDWKMHCNSEMTIKFTTNKQAQINKHLLQVQN